MNTGANPLGRLDDAVANAAGKPKTSSGGVTPTPNLLTRRESTPRQDQRVCELTWQDVLSMARRLSLLRGLVRPKSGQTDNRLRPNAASVND